MSLAQKRTAGECKFTARRVIAWIREADARQKSAIRRLEKILAECDRAGLRVYRQVTEDIAIEDLVAAEAVGFVIFSGDGEALSSYLAWFPASPGFEWVHDSLPDTNGWEFQPERVSLAAYDGERTVLLADLGTWPAEERS